MDAEGRKINGDPTVLIGGNFNTLMQNVMAMRTPELMAFMPQVDAMSYEAKVAYVEKGHGNLVAVIKNWDKVGDILLGQGWTKPQVKKKAKGLKSARSHLEKAMKLTDRKLFPPVFHAQADAAFDVMVAFMLMDADNVGSVLSGPTVSKSSLRSGEIPLMPMPPAAEAVTPLEDDLEQPAIREEIHDGPANARILKEDLQDLVEAEGGDFVFH